MTLPLEFLQSPYLGDDGLQLRTQLLSVQSQHGELLFVERKPREQPPHGGTVTGRNAYGRGGSAKGRVRFSDGLVGNALELQAVLELEEGFLILGSEGDSEGIGGESSWGRLTRRMDALRQGVSDGEVLAQDDVVGQLSCALGCGSWEAL
jgi:hypothetical protein